MATDPREGLPAYPILFTDRRANINALEVCDITLGMRVLFVNTLTKRRIAEGFVKKIIPGSMTLRSRFGKQVIVVHGDFLRTNNLEEIFNGPIKAFVKSTPLSRYRFREFQDDE
jgi:hypothetical protein